MEHEHDGQLQLREHRPSTAVGAGAGFGRKHRLQLTAAAGVHRALILFGLPDIRLLIENDARFLKQFV